MFDSSASGFDGSINGATRVTGQFGNALSFDSNDTVTFAGSSSLAMVGDTTFTVSVWANSLSSSGTCCGQLAGFRNQGGWTLRHDFRDAQKIEFLERTASGYFGDGGADGVNIASGWHMITSVVDTNVVRMYVDGVLTDSYGFTGTTSIDATANMVIGAVVDGNLAGSLDDLQIYDEALTAAQLGTLLTGGTVSGSTTPPAEVPAPATLWLVLAGALGFARFGKARRGLRVV